MISCFLDSREHKLIELLSPICTKTLDIGDIFLQDGSFELVIERKTWNDLRASIRDGRFREQRSRLRDWKISTDKQIVYFVEGNYEESFFMERRTCDRLMIGYGIPVFFFDSIEKTAQKVKEWSEMESLQKLFQTRDIQQDQVEARITQTKKRNYDDPYLYLTGLLLQMKGVSSKMAEAIAKEFQCIACLIEKLREKEEETILLLKNIAYQTDSKKTKKVPASIVERLVINLGMKINKD